MGMPAARTNRLRYASIASNRVRAENSGNRVAAAGDVHRDPVSGKWPCPRDVSLRASVSSTVTVTYNRNDHLRKPHAGLRVKARVPPVRLINITPTSAPIPGSIVPGVFCAVMSVLQREAAPAAALALRYSAAAQWKCVTQSLWSRPVRGTPTPRHRMTTRRLRGGGGGQNPFRRQSLHFQGRHHVNTPRR